MYGNTDGFFFFFFTVLVTSVTLSKQLRFCISKTHCIHSIPLSHTTASQKKILLPPAWSPIMQEGIEKLSEWYLASSQRAAVAS